MLFTLENFIKDIENIKKGITKKMTDKEILKYININFKKVVNKYYESFKIDARKYYNERNKYNKAIFNIAKKSMNELKNAFKNEEIKKHINFEIMSSFNAKLNLIGESDIDIGCLEKNLDESKLFQIISVLEKLGYTHTYILNPQSINNKYYAFSKFVKINSKDKIEVEVKIRDYDYSLPVLELHNYLDNKLTDKERISYTFLKSVLKNHSKEYYNMLKTMIFNTYFYYVKGGFVLNL